MKQPKANPGLMLIRRAGMLCAVRLSPVLAIGAALAVLAVGWSGAGAAPADRSGADASWPCYRHDNQRSGYTPFALKPPLTLYWSWASPRSPWPAWPEPGKEWNRLAFDYAFQVSVGRGKVFFGSSTDHQVHALDLATGREVWTFFTEGPVRFAPVLAGKRLFVASDDGCVYCLDADSGRLLWRFFGGPRDERVMGNGQMISRWPARSGVLVDGDRVYFTAGMWSSDGVFVYALRVSDGRVLWKNDTCSQLYMGLPHSAMEGIAGLAPQGYLVLHQGVVAVPQGRAMPAALDAATGKLLYCDNSATKLHHAGGSWVIADQGLVWGERRPLLADIHVHLGEADPTPGEGLIAWDLRTGAQRLALVGKHRAVIHKGVLYCTGSGDLAAVPLAGLKQVAAQFYASGKLDPEAPEGYVGAAQMFHRGTKLPWFTSKVDPVWPRPRRWQTPVGRTYELIMAGDVLFAAGRREVTVVSAADGKVLQRLEVPYEARGLAVAEGRLLVSCTTGQILCFGPKAAAGGQSAPAGATGAAPQAPGAPSPAPPTISPQARRAAREILNASGVREGYCLLLGAGEGDLALALAQLTKQSAESSRSEKGGPPGEVNAPVYPFAEPPRFSAFTIYCPVRDEVRLAALRRRLASAGLYGVRVAVHHVPGPKLPYADYFANLVVADEVLGDDLSHWSLAELYRVLRPYGGVALLRPRHGGAQALAERLRRGGAQAGAVTVREGWVVVRRGPLPGAGQWTHEYGDAGRSGASSDTHVRLPLKMLWWGGPGPARMISRHWRSPSPLFSNGRLYVCGENHLIAVDAYNGRELWCRELPAVGRFSARYRGGNIVCDERCVYALQGTTCLQFDGATGKTLRTYHPPPQALQLTPPPNPITTARGGKAKARPVKNQLEWEYLAVTDDLVVGSIGVPNFAWSWWPEAFPETRYLFALRKKDASLAWLYKADESVSPNTVAIVGERVYLLDRTSEAQVARAKRRGEELSVKAALKALDLRSGKVVKVVDGAPTASALWASADVLLLTARGRAWAYAIPELKPLWSVRSPIQGSPVLLGDTVYLYPRAYDLHTGKIRQTHHPLTGDVRPLWVHCKGGCGGLSGCPAALFFRAGAAGMYNIADDSGIAWLGQARASCWINMLPAGGMLLMPEGASCCTCPYNFQTSLAMVADRRQENWSLYVADPPPMMSKIKHLSLNFGAVGDQRASDGNLWLTFPRPFRAGVITLPLMTRGSVEYWRRNADTTSVSGTALRWIYTSGCRGPLKATLDLLFNRPAETPRAATPPHLDGVLDDACWDGRKPLVFTDDNQQVDGRVAAWLRYDDENLYVGFRRQASRREGKLVPWTATAKGEDAPCWLDDALNLRFFCPQTGTGLYLWVSCSGARFDGIGGPKFSGNVGARPRWSGRWLSAVQRSPKQWTAEVALPWQTLEKAGLKKKWLRIYLESANQTGVGPRAVHYKYREWRRLHLFAQPTRLFFGTLPPAPETTYRVRLHFVELDGAQPGERVFDVKLQGKTVLRGVDIARETGGARALVREIQGVRAGDSLSLELVPRKGRPPILCALELDQTSPSAKGAKTGG